MTAPSNLPLERDAGQYSNSPACGAPNPLQLMHEEHALHLELCDLLEAIADGLPATFDRALATVAIAILPSSLPAHTSFEDDAFFPVLRRRAASNAELCAALECLGAEHDRDSGALIEVTDALKSAVGAGRVENPEMLGYLLRGFFESHRRHIAWEERVVIPAARAVLTPEDLSQLQTWIMGSDHPRCCRQSISVIRSARTARALCDTCSSRQNPNSDPSACN